MDTGDNKDTKRGRLIGIGVGPGDPELMTLKAVRLINECDFVVVPNSGKADNVALTIAKGACPDIETKLLLNVDMPMIRDKEALLAHQRAAATQIANLLNQGKNGVFLTLGDPTVYSTYMHVHKILMEAGFETAIVPGITSFCAAAARLNISLTDPHQALHIIPASYDGLEAQLAYKGTKVLMKSGKSLSKIKETLSKLNNIDVKMVECCGMADEKTYQSLAEIDETAGYFSLLIVRET